MQEKIKVNFVMQNGEVKTVLANSGETILQVAKFNDIPIEGACDGSLACSTCHVVVDESWFFGELAEKSYEEEDMLDIAIGLTPTSRLGCQIRLNKSMNGLTLKLVSDSRNFLPNEILKG